VTLQNDNDDHHWCYALLVLHARNDQFLDKPYDDASTSVAWSCNWEFAAISRSISETVQVSAKVTTECEY